MKIKDYLANVETAKTADIAEAVGLKVSRTRELLAAMDDVEAIGENRNRTYRIIRTD